MWVSTLLLLSLYGGISGTRGDDLCDHDISTACENKEQFRFPGSAEDLDRACPILLEHLTCILNYERDCGKDRRAGANNFNKIFAYVTDVCRNDSEIHDDIVKHLPCLKEITDNPDSGCRNLTREAMKLYEKHQRANDPDYDDSYYSTFYYCFFQMHEMACFIAKVDRKCGAGAKDIALYGQNRMGVLDDICPADESTEMLELVQVLEIEMKQRELIKEIISVNTNY